MALCEENCQYYKILESIFPYLTQIHKENRKKLYAKNDTFKLVNVIFINCHLSDDIMMRVSCYPH